MEKIKDVIVLLIFVLLFSIAISVLISSIITNRALENQKKDYDNRLDDLKDNLIIDIKNISESLNNESNEDIEKMLGDFITEFEKDIGRLKKDNRKLRDKINDLWVFVTNGGY